MASVTGAAAIGAGVTGELTQLPLVALYALAERARLVLVILFTATVLSLTGCGALAAEPVTVAVADFDYSDTSGEIKDQVDAHRARVVAFGQLLRDGLQSEGKYRVVGLDCPDGGCTAASMRSDDFLAHGRRSGARLVWRHSQDEHRSVGRGSSSRSPAQRIAAAANSYIPRRYRHGVPPRGRFCQRNVEGCHALNSRVVNGGHVHP